MSLTIKVAWCTLFHDLRDREHIGLSLCMDVAFGSILDRSLGCSVRIGTDIIVSSYSPCTSFVLPLLTTRNT